MTPNWLLRAWDEALEEDMGRSVQRRPTNLNGFRLPRRGRWELTFPGIRLSVPALPQLVSWQIGAIVAGLVALLVGLIAGFISHVGHSELLAHLVSWKAVCLLVPAMGTVLAQRQDAIPVVQSTQGDQQYRAVRSDPGMGDRSRRTRERQRASGIHEYNLRRRLGIRRDDRGAANGGNSTGGLAWFPLRLHPKVDAALQCPPRHV